MTGLRLEMETTRGSKAEVRTVGPLPTGDALFDAAAELELKANRLKAGPHQTEALKLADALAERVMGVPVERVAADPIVYGPLRRPTGQ